MKLRECDENDHSNRDACKLINKALPNLIVNISNVLWYSIDPVVVQKLGFVAYQRTWEFLQQPINTSCCGEVRNLPPWPYNQYFWFSTRPLVLIFSNCWVETQWFEMTPFLTTYSRCKRRSNRFSLILYLTVVISWLSTLFIYIYFTNKSEFIFWSTLPEMNLEWLREVDFFIHFRSKCLKGLESKSSYRLYQFGHFEKGSNWFWLKLILELGTKCCTLMCVNQ